MPASRSRTTRKPAAPAPARPSIPIGEIYRGHRRLALIRDLAMGELSSAEIARNLGLGTKDIEDFRETYTSEVAEVRAALAGRLAIETAGLWISKKQNRVAEVQADIEDINYELNRIRSGTLKDIDEAGGLGSRKHQNLLRMKLAALKLVADEYSVRGMSKADSEEDDRNVVHYVIDLDDSFRGALT